MAQCHCSDNVLSARDNKMCDLVRKYLNLRWIFCLLLISSFKKEALAFFAFKKNI